MDQMIIELSGKVCKHHLLIERKDDRKQAIASSLPVDLNEENSRCKPSLLLISRNKMSSGPDDRKLFYSPQFMIDDQN